MGDYRRRTSTDSPERKETIRNSWDIQSLRLAARASRLSFRRHRYGVGGRIAYDLGEYGPDGRGVYGIIFFTDSGQMAQARLFHMTEPTYLPLSALVRTLPVAAAAARARTIFNTAPIDIPLSVELPEIEDTMNDEQPQTPSKERSPLMRAWTTFASAVLWFTLFFVIWMMNPSVFGWAIVAFLASPVVIYAVKMHDRALSEIA